MTRPLLSEVFDVNIARKGDVFWVWRKSNKTLFSDFYENLYGEGNWENNNHKDISWELWAAVVTVRRMLEYFTRHYIGASIVRNNDGEPLGYCIYPNASIPLHLHKYLNIDDINYDPGMDMMLFTPLARQGKLSRAHGYWDRHLIPLKYRWRSIPHPESRRSVKKYRRQR